MTAHNFESHISYCVHANYTCTVYIFACMYMCLYEIIISIFNAFTYIESFAPVYLTYTCIALLANQFRSFYCYAIEERNSTIISEFDKRQNKFAKYTSQAND